MRIICTLCYKSFWKANCGRVLYYWDTFVSAGVLCQFHEMCQEAFRSKHVRELQCGHRLLGVSSLWHFFTPRILTVECLEKRKGLFPRLILASSKQIPSVLCAWPSSLTETVLGEEGRLQASCALSTVLSVLGGESTRLSQSFPKIPKSVISLHALTRTVKQTVEIACQFSAVCEVLTL